MNVIAMELIPLQLSLHNFKASYANGKEDLTFHNYKLHDFVEAGRSRTFVASCIGLMKVKNDDL